jgi:tRNA(Ile)-lysidine synthase
MNLFSTFARRCRAGELFSPSDSLLLAVSGGIDSMVMLDLFVELSKRQEQKLSVAHVDHQLRAESVADAKFVEAMAALHGLPFFCEIIEVRQHAREHKLSLEAAARGLRYEALERMRQSAGARLIATAHTRDDQAETVLYRLLRGAGLAGLAGMAQKRANLIRPLLSFSRADILDYAQRRRLQWREDASNQDLNIPRNRLRRDIIPRLAEHFNPEVAAALTRTAKIAREAHAFMQSAAEAALLHAVKDQTPERIVLDIQRINEYNRLIHAMMLRQAAQRLNGSKFSPSHRHIERAVKLMASGRVGARQSLGAGIEVLRDRNELVLVRSPIAEYNEEVKLQVPCLLPGTPWRLMVAEEIWRGTQTLTTASPRSEYVDAAAVQGPLRVRTPHAGDNFYPLGLGHAKKLADFFSDAKLPLWRRAVTPLLECEKGIVWVCGLRIDDRFKVTVKTTRVLHLQLVKKNELEAS